MRILSTYAAALALISLPSCGKQNKGPNTSDEIIQPKGPDVPPKPNGQDSGGATAPGGSSGAPSSGGKGIPGAQRPQ